MIKVTNLCKSFAGHVLLDNISFDIKQGSCTAIAGSSGAGKTTLMRMLNGLEQPNGGIILVDNIEVNTSNIQAVRNTVGFVFQNFNLFPHMTVLENIIFTPLKILKMNKDEVLKRATELLLKFHLHEIKNSYPSKISGGQKQRVAIIRCLMMNPKIIILDEPTSALDPRMINELSESISLLQNLGVTLLIITHQYNFIQKTCQDIMFISKGQIIEHCTIGQFELSQNAIVREYLSHV
jgi:polar amino acid transport system ATP-binding protein